MHHFQGSFNNYAALENQDVAILIWGMGGEKCEFRRYMLTVSFIDVDENKQNRQR